MLGNGTGSYTNIINLYVCNYLHLLNIQIFPLIPVIKDKTLNIDIHSSVGQGLPPIRQNLFFFQLILLPLEFRSFLMLRKRKKLNAFGTFSSGIIRRKYGNNLLCKRIPGDLAAKLKRNHFHPPLWAIHVYSAASKFRNRSQWGGSASFSGPEMFHRREIRVP